MDPTQPDPLASAPSDNAAIILRLLLAAGESGLTQTQLRRRVRGGHVRAAKLAHLLQWMTTRAGLIHWTVDASRGPTPVTTWRLTPLGRDRAQRLLATAPTADLPPIPAFARPAASAAGEPEIDEPQDAEAAARERFENAGGFVLHVAGGECFLVFADGLVRASAVLAVQRDGAHVRVSFGDESRSFRPWPRKETPEPPPSDIAGMTDGVTQPIGIGDEVRHMDGGPVFRIEDVEVGDEGRLALVCHRRLSDGTETRIRIHPHSVRRAWDEVEPVAAGGQVQRGPA